jgi:hypothetical protein
MERVGEAAPPATGFADFQNQALMGGGGGGEGESEGDKVLAH